MPSPSVEQLLYLGPLLDHTEDAIVACDVDWRVTVWSEGARHMLGWTAEEVVGRPGALLRTDETDPQRMHRRRQLSRHGRWRGTVKVQRKDGSEVPVEAVAVAIRDEEGEISGYLGIHRDVTERKEAEQLVAEAREAEQARIARDLHDGAAARLERRDRSRRDGGQDRGGVFAARSAAACSATSRRAVAFRHLRPTVRGARSTRRLSSGSSGSSTGTGR